MTIRTMLLTGFPLIFGPAPMAADSGWEDAIVQIFPIFDDEPEYEADPQPPLIHRQTYDSDRGEKPG